MIDKLSMSLYELLSLIISLLSFIVSAAGFLTIIVSLWFLTKQTKISQNSLEEMLISQLKNQETEIDKLFIENPEMRKYFYDNVEVNESDADNFARASAIAEYILDFFSAMIYSRNAYDKVNIKTPRWTKYTIDLFANSPILRSMIDKHEDWYSAELKNRKNEALELSHEKEKL